MAKGYRLLIALLILKTSVLVTSYCPPDKTHSVGHCSFRIRCTGAIRDVQLPEQCRGSTNYPVTVDLTLTDAIERIDDNIDTDFLNTVETLRVSAHWPQTSLALIEYMPNLENLYLSGNKIEHITSHPFYRLNNLKDIDLSNNHLTNLEDLFTFESDSKLKRLSLANNAIAELQWGVFGELTSLIELDLSHNFLSDLTDEPFSNLTSLQTLRLNNNNIKDLNGAINYLRNLRHFYVGGNQLNNIDAESLQIIYDLETFDVSGNDLDTLKPTVFWRHWPHFDGKSVCKIIISKNHITNVPNATKEITKRFTHDLSQHEGKVATDLDLSKNEISNVEYNAFQTIVRLTKLDLSSNKLCNFVINPNDLVDVKVLNLSNNLIAVLYFESFSSMTNLYNLDLSHNKLEYIPENTFNKNHILKYVNMSNNTLIDLKQLHIKLFHTSGGVLDLSDNGLETLEISFNEAKRLTILTLDSNNIIDASKIILSHQNDLKKLVLSRNQIEILNKNSLRLPVSLAILDFSFNRICDIGPSTFRYVSHLYTLQLSHNNLTTLTYGIFHGLKELRNLDLSYNKISYLDSKLLTDLKLLRVLYLGYNKMIYLEDKGWLGHKIDLQVYVDGNNLTCEWLGTALGNFENGYTKVRPTVQMESTVGHSLEGIPCVPESEVSQRLVDLGTTNVQTDERLLMTSQKILEEIKEQNYFLRKILRLPLQNNRL